MRYGQESNAIFCHVRDNDHRINWSDSRILMKSSNFQERNIIESIIIKNSFNDNLNLSLGLYNVDPVLEKTIIQFLKLKGLTFT